MNVSLMIEGQMGIDWPRWMKVARAAEELGFTGLYRSDHFVMPGGPMQPSLEMVVSLAWLATNTSRVRFGPLVSPVSFRDPVMLARQAAALDELSGGRMDLGLGTGWMDREHDAFGYDLGDVATRFARLEEGLEVVTALLRTEGPVSHTGRFFTLRDAEIAPRPGPGPRIVIGGNGMRRLLGLAARYADVWNGVFLTPHDFRARCDALDELAAACGRAPRDVKRTLMTGVSPGRSDRFEEMRARGAIIGEPDEMRAQLDELARAGCDEVMLQWLQPDDEAGLRAIAAAVL